MQLEDDATRTGNSNLPAWTPTYILEVCRTTRTARGTWGSCFLEAHPPHGSTAGPTRAPPCGTALALARGEHHQSPPWPRKLPTTHPACPVGQIHLHPRPGRRIAQGRDVGVQPSLGTGFKVLERGVGRGRRQLNRVHVPAQVMVANPCQLGKPSCPIQHHTATQHTLCIRWCQRAAIRASGSAGC